MALLRAGYTTTVYSRSPKPHPSAEASEAVGAPYLSSEEVGPEELARRVGPIELVYEAAGSAQAAFGLLGVLGPNGVFVFTGVPGGAQKLGQDGSELMRGLVLGNRLAFGTVNASDADFAGAIEDLGRFQQRWPGGVERLITARHPPEAYAQVVREKGIKHVIQFG
jgi:threonine dehydrogenase-like Zn-dependent dehydrogenase